MSKSYTYREFAFSTIYPFNVINAMMRDLGYSSETMKSSSSLEHKIRWMIDNLPLKEKDVLYSCFEKKTSFEELSETYNTTIQNIRATYNRGMFFLLEQWDIVVNKVNHGFDMSFLESNPKFKNHINSLCCSRKAYNALLHAKIITIGDIVTVLHYDPTYILKSNHFGMRSYEDLLKRLDVYLDSKDYYRKTYSLEKVKVK